MVLSTLSLHIMSSTLTCQVHQLSPVTVKSGKAWGSQYVQPSGGTIRPSQPVSIVFLYVALAVSELTV